VLLDDVAVALLVPSCVPDLAASHAVQLQHRLLGERERGAALVDQRQRVPVTANLLLVAVTQCRLAEDHRGHPGRVDLDALDPVRRHRALDQGVLPQGLEPLRGLPGEELLSPPGFGEIGQIPDRGGGHGLRADAELPKRVRSLAHAAGQVTISAPPGPRWPASRIGPDAGPRRSRPEERTRSRR